MPVLERNVPCAPRRRQPLAPRAGCDTASLPRDTSFGTWALPGDPSKPLPVHGIAHDLGNLLSLILGYAEMALEGLGDG
ncbi:MAG TPA: hypothetical protein P5532_23375, partial [Planctomycetota bacterium]|nr:hypothetical protein [Planctomycetota bacterium]